MVPGEEHSAVKAKQITGEHTAIRPPDPAETPLLVQLAVATGLFSPVEADLLLRDTLNNFHEGRLGEDHIVRVWSEGEGTPPTGWAYFARNAASNQVWDLWWIGVTPDRHGEGIGRALLTAVESHVLAAEGRLLIVETSSLPTLARARKFYMRSKYVACGEVPDFYADGDNKITFAKRLTVRAP